MTLPLSPSSARSSDAARNRPSRWRTLLEGLRRSVGPRRGHPDRDVRLDAQGSEHGGIRADAEVRLVDCGLDHGAIGLAAREQSQWTFAAADRERAVDLDLGRRYRGRHGARPEIDRGMPARVEHVADDGRLDLAAILLGERARVVLAADLRADHAERGRMEVGVDALVVDGDLESLDAELEIVGR